MWGTGPETGSPSPGAPGPGPPKVQPVLPTRSPRVMRLPLACAGTLALCLSAQKTGWLVRGESTDPRTPPEGEDDLHQAPHLQTAAPRGRGILGGAQMLEVPAQQPGPKTRNSRLWLQRFEAVGWIWSLACFTQPISREVWLPNRPAEHQEHERALPGCATPVRPAGGQARVCVFGGLPLCVPPVSSQPIPGSGPEGGCFVVLS